MQVAATPLISEFIIRDLSDDCRLSLRESAFARGAKGTLLPSWIPQELLERQAGVADEELIRPQSAGYFETDCR